VTGGESLHEAGAILPDNSKRRPGAALYVLDFEAAGVALRADLSKYLLHDHARDRYGRPGGWPGTGERRPG
jgi:hypothetical protein